MKRMLLLVLLFLMSIILSCPACGKKAPPVLPQKDFSAISPSLVVGYCGGPAKEDRLIDDIEKKEPRIPGV